MPLLQFRTSRDLSAEPKRRFADAVTDAYADHMRTGTDHVAVAISECSPADLSLGRVTDPDAPVLLLDAEIRQGRSFEAKRAFALAVIDLAREEWDLPRESAKVVFTEHPGENMMGADRVGGEWSPDEADDG
jgi:phenylpyruvate tautomerase PptA (4-oxalocrotonate tautomerase family)